jgi:hypothetical protein
MGLAALDGLGSLVLTDAERMRHEREMARGRIGNA